MLNLFYKYPSLCLATLANCSVIQLVPMPLLAVQPASTTHLPSPRPSLAPQMSTNTCSKAPTTYSSRKRGGSPPNSSASMMTHSAWKHTISSIDKGAEKSKKMKTDDIEDTEQGKAKGSSKEKAQKKGMK